MLEEKFERTKLEILRDYATALRGQRALLSDMADKCESIFGKDFGLQSAVVVLDLSLDDIVIDTERLRLGGESCE